MPVTPQKPYSMDANLLHISYEGGVLEDPWVSPPAGMFRMTVDPESAPDEPEVVTVAFVRRHPGGGRRRGAGPGRAAHQAQRLGGRHGVGRVDIVENRFVGMKSRGVYETPGGTILHHAHRAVESITLDREVAHLRDELVPRYAEMVYNGFWFSPSARRCRPSWTRSRRGSTARRGSCSTREAVVVEGRRSESHDLYDQATATFEEDDVYDQADAAGFIRLHALRLRTLAEHRLGDGE